jgi:hypothetical protein
VKVALLGEEYVKGIISLILGLNNEVADFILGSLITGLILASLALI